MYCPKCGADAGDAKFCPNCGANLSGEVKQEQPQQTQTVIVQEKPKKKKHTLLKVVVALIVFFVVYNAVSSSMNSTTGGASTGTGTTTQSKPDLEVLDVSSTNDGYVRYATGHIKNNTDHDYSYVQVEISLYSGETQVGSTLDNVTNLKAGATWEFSAPILENSADRFEVADVTGY